MFEIISFLVIFGFMYGLFNFCSWEPESSYPPVELRQSPLPEEYLQGTKMILSMGNSKEWMYAKIIGLEKLYSCSRMDREELSGLLLDSYNYLSKLEKPGMEGLVLTYRIKKSLNERNLL